MFRLRSKILYALFFAGIANAQAQQGHVAAGGDGAGTGGSFSFSVGQIDFSNDTAEGININQGIQQPYEFFVITAVEDLSIQLDATVYPNPTRESVTLKINLPVLDGCSYSLFDINGQLVETCQITTSITPIVMEHLAMSTYVLNIQNQNQVIKTFQIIKNF